MVKRFAQILAKKKKNNELNAKATKYLNELKQKLFYTQSTYVYN